MSIKRFLFCLSGVFLALTLVVGGPQSADAQAAPAPVSRDDDRERSRPARVPSDVASLRGNRPEYVVGGPISSAPAAVAALENAGAVLISYRDLAALDRRVMMFDLRWIDLDDARRLLAQTAPDQRADFNHLYKYAQDAPRLYASAMVGDPATGGCHVGQNHRLGLIDGPVASAHSALRQANLVIGTAIAHDQRLADTEHGTAVAALMVGDDPDGVLSGFAAGAQLFAINAFAAEHSGIAADVDRIGTSLSWLLSNNVQLINMSFTGPPNRVLEDLLSQAERKGAMMIAAAGNDGRHVAMLPAASASVIAVTAVDAAMRRYRAANWGAHIEFAAPGVDVYVAQRNGGAYATGTSYAAPIVTAFAVRLGPTSLADLRRKLRSRALDLGTPGRDAEYGWGLVRDIGC